LPAGILKGAIIRRILPNGPADRASLKENDVVVELSGRAVRSSAQLMNEVAMVRPGTTVDLKVYRGDQLKELQVTVEERTDEKMSQFSDRTEVEAWGLVLDTVTPGMANELEIPESIQGAVILEMDRSKRAAKLRLQPGDVIKSIDDTPIRSGKEAKEALSKVGRQIKLVIQRGPIEMSISTSTP
jgi:serine protease Do